MQETINSLLSGGGVWVLGAIVMVGVWIVRGHYDNKSDMRDLRKDFKYMRRDLNGVMKKLGLDGSKMED